MPSAMKQQVEGIAAPAGQCQHCVLVVYLQHLQD